MNVLKRLESTPVLGEIPREKCLIFGNTPSIRTTYVIEHMLSTVFYSRDST